MYIPSDASPGCSQPMTEHGGYTITGLFLIDTGSLYELLLLGGFPIALSRNFLDGEVI